MKKFLGVGLLLVFLFCAPSDATILSTFDCGIEDWTVSGLATLSHSSSGGNPGGYLKVAEGGGDTFEVVAPTKFLGNLSAFKGGLLSFDSVLISTSSYTFGDGFGRVTIIGGGYNATLDLAPNPPETTWKTYSALMLASTWGVNDLQWNAILANVSQIRIILESVVGWETMGFDNFKVQSVPEPATILLLASGLAGLVWMRRNFKKKEC